MKKPSRQFLWLIAISSAVGQLYFGLEVLQQYAKIFGKLLDILLVQPLTVLPILVAIKESW